MKKSTLVLLCLLSSIVLARAGSPYSVVVTNASTMLLPPTQVETDVTVTNNQAIAQGTLRTLNRDTLWAVDYGTETNATGRIGATGTTTNDSVTWRAASRQPRHGFVLSNTGTNGVYVSFGYPAVLSKGIYLANNSVMPFDENVPQTGVYAINPNPTGLTIFIQEW